MRAYYLFLNLIKKIKDSNKKIDDIADKIYPVGSIYMSMNSTNPSELFGGTWQSIQASFLVSTGGPFNAGDTGGEAAVSLTADQLPAHTHGSKSLTGSFYAYSWMYGGASGKVSKTDTYNPINAGVYAGSNIGHQTYTIDVSHEHTSVGKGYAHNNLPPYLVVYMWKRTA